MAQAYTSVLKFNVDGRPYVKDIHDLFSALVTQVKFSSHKYLFTSYENTMTSEDILEVLSNLQFIQSISLPDSEGQGRLNTTITTTTFNMQRGVAKALCQQFIWARLMYNATDPLNRSYRDKALWKLTMKGLIILHEFCQLLDMNHLLLSNDKISIEEYRLLTLERNEDDQLITSRSNMISLFRIMIHALSEDENGLLLSKHTNRDNTIVHKIKKKRNNRHNQQQKIRKQQQQLRKSSLTSSSSISSSSTTSSCMKNGYPPQHYYNQQHEDEAQESEEEYTVIRKMRVIFTSQVCCDWLSASCSIACRDEAELLSTEFLRHGWIRFYKESYQEELNFVSSSKDIFLSVTPKGRQLVIDGIHSSTSYSTSTITSPSDTPLTTPVTPTTPVFTFRSPSSRRGSANLEDPSSSSSPCYLTHPLDQQKELKETPNLHSAKLMAILKDPHLRSLFKDFLKANYCVENLDFWIDYHHLKTKCKNQSPALNKQYQKDLLEDAIAIWAKYLSPKAKHELNVDHGLQKELKQYIKSIVKFEYSSTSITSSSSLKKKDRYTSYTNLVYISTQSNAQCLRTILKRFDCVELQICRLMASDSVPKFVSWLRTAKKNDKINLLQQNLQSLKL
ncbi:regulator of G protein signaling domain-containing protein [Cunninghamella echinulata]|nr:regulator of G protein signaling domain-containing protein [Cunninghamella echinulata]